ncbi:MAG TPA: diacylglycerol kinase [Steroidobacteraceae bacterium]|jgi:diacylglycerol kinase (ATP)|nr:diacylglycerol kinase [Steroidobacteraceae bacterium]HTG76551.1 diacylglycerol kinase [Steroidobacteraceae bacterium]
MDGSMMRQGLRPQGLKRLWLATGHSLRGLRLSYSSEAAFRQEVWLAVVLLPLAFFLGESAVERAMLAGSVLVLLIVELLNTAIEVVVDRIGLERHALSGFAKDAGSAAVMLTLALVALTWGLILFV